MNKTKIRQGGDFTEIFRSALMKVHSDDWDMETVADASYICATMVQPYIDILTETLSKDTKTYQQGYSAGYNAGKRERNSHAN